MRLRFISLLAALALGMGGCAQTQFAAHMIKNAPFGGAEPSKSQGSFKVGNPYEIQGRAYFPKESYDLVEKGIASWYGPNFHGKMTANGEIFNKRDLTAAHRTLQMPSLIRVTNLENGNSLVLRVNDRGPYSKGRVLDVSERAAELLGFKNQGTAKVKIQVLEKESRQIAEAAKRGMNTRGTELALNKGKGLDFADPVRIAAKPPVSQPAPAETVMETVQLSTVRPVQEVSLVQQLPVSASNIYVQLGAFSNEANARAMLRRIAQNFEGALIAPTEIGGRPFYRVRVGPLSDVVSADQILNSAVDRGFQTAMIVVD